MSAQGTNTSRFATPPIHDLYKVIGKRVVLKGWVQTVRNQKQVQFVVLRDSSGSVQLVHRRGSSEEIADVIDGLSTDSIIEVSGTVIADERVKLGGLEIPIESLRVLSAAEPLPIDEATNLDGRLDWRFIDLRRARNQCLFAVQTTLLKAFRDACRERQFIELQTPKLMASPSESRSELFEVGYFEGKAYLAQSPQFYKQMGVASGFPGVFEVGPVFRANPSFTSRHDTEFTSLDVEMAWIDSHEDVMMFEEELLARALADIQAAHGEAIRSEYKMEVDVPSLPFPRISHSDAIQMVLDDGYRIPRADGDLDPEAERRLCRLVKEDSGHDFVFVTDYPTSVRPFYHMRYESAPDTTKSYDLLWRGLEITTGAQREHRPDVLTAQVREKGLDPVGLQFYLDFFRFGCPPHGGFGLGMTRLLMILLGQDNVREVTYLYRGPNRLTP